MKKLLLLFSLIIISVSDSFSQSHKFQWAASIGGTKGAELNACSATDKNGNIYTGGSFSGETDFDPSIGSYTIVSKNIDAYIMKLDADGNFRWVKTIPSASQVIVTAIVTDTLGNIYVSGTYSDTIVFEIGSYRQYAHSSQGNIFYAKLDSNGNFIWAKALNDKSSISMPPNSENSKLKLDHNGNLIIAGFFRNRLDFNAGIDSFFLSSSGYYGETFVLKTNNLGEFIWAKNFKATKLWNECLSIGIDSKNSIFLTGYFDDSMKVNLGAGTDFLLSEGNDDMYLVKLDSSGNYLWAKRFGNKRTDKGTSIVVDKFDNLLMAGYFTDTLKIIADTGIVKVLSSISDDAILMKFDNNGKFKWFKKFQGFIAECKPSDIKQDKNDNIYLVGEFYGNIDFDPGVDSFNIKSYSFGIFLTKFDSTGTFVYAKSFEPNNVTSLTPTLSIDQNSSVFISGNFTIKMDANPSVDSFILNSFDRDDLEAFTIKLSNCSTSFGTETVTTCGSYFLADQEYISSGVYKKNLISTTGCDSLITLNLTILPKPIASITHVSANTLKCYNTGVKYQWVSCPTYTPIINDTNSVFNAPFRGYFAVIVSNGMCSDTSECRIIEPSNIISYSKSFNIIKLYPNPFNHTATLEFENPQSRSCHLSVFNSLGQLVMSIDNIKNNKVLIDRKELQSGLYFYQLRNEEAIIGNGKMMIE